MTFRSGTSTQLGCSEISVTAQNFHHYEKSNSIALIYAQTENEFLDQHLLSLFTHTKKVFRDCLLRRWDWRIVVELEPAAKFHDFYFCTKLKERHYSKGYTRCCQFTTEDRRKKN